MSNEYTVTAQTGMALPPGTAIKLTEQQLGLRRHQVKPVKGRRGYWISDEPLNFKRGEVIETDAELPKSLAILTDKPAPVAKPTLNAVQQDARDRGEAPAKKPAADESAAKKAAAEAAAKNDAAAKAAADDAEKAAGQPPLV